MEKQKALEVNSMAKKYSDLFELINANARAHEYFDTLPDYVQETISERASHINSFASLCDYAENLTRGDN